MLRAEIIGNLGADIEQRNEQGNTFYAFRVANTDKWKDEQGNVKTETTWVDCTMNKVSENLLPYLKQGVKVFVRGNLRLRVYSSKKDRCMKAGARLFVSEIDLVGGESDGIPRQLVNPENGQIYDVEKYAHISIETKGWKKDEVREFVTQKGEVYLVNKEGWVAPPQQQEQGSDEKNLEENQAQQNNAK